MEGKKEEKGEKEMEREKEQSMKELKERFPKICLTNEEKLAKLIKLFENPSYSPDSQLTYCYLILFYSQPNFDPLIISKIITLLDKIWQHNPPSNPLSSS